VYGRFSSGRIIWARVLVWGRRLRNSNPKAYD
jgi:hypothetical protein